MDFKAIYKQIRSIDEGIDNMGECGMMPMGAGPAGQSDSVNMNVSLNASGGGGIRELMNVLKNIDNVATPQHGHGDEQEDPMFGDSFEEEFGNSMAGHDGPATAPVSAVLPTGDDLASKGKEAKAVNGGGNPLARKSSMEEGIADQLQNLYTEIKARQVDEGAASRIADKVIGGMTKQAAKQVSPEVVEQHYKAWIKSPNRPYNVDRGGNADMQQVVDTKVTAYLKTTDIPVEQQADLATQLKRKFMVSDPSTHMHTN